MPISQAALFGFAAYENYAPWPVWSDSTPKPVRFEPVPKKEAHRRYWMARQFDRVTKIGGGCQGGAVGTPALKVLEALTFDFLNYASGRLDPGYKALAQAANISVSAVHTALRRLRDLGILVWQRRCDEGWSGGRYFRRQETNAYSIRPCSEWRGFVPPKEAPAPLPDIWGRAPYMPNIIDAAVAAGKAHGPKAQLEALRLAAYGPRDGAAELMAALASLGASVAASGKK
jgi:hypothetical protein